MTTISQFWKSLKQIGLKFFTDNGPFLASGLSFDLILYCLPLPVLFVSGLGYTLIGSERALAWVQDIIVRLLPEFQEPFLSMLSSLIDNRGILGFTGFFLFFLFSSAVFSSARHALSNVFHVEKRRGFFKGKGNDFLLMLVLSLLIIVLVLLNSVLSLIQSYGERIPAFQDLFSPIWFVVGKAFGFTGLGALFYLFYGFSTPTRLSQPALLIGSLTAAGLFEASKSIFSWYVHLAQILTAFYGVLSGFIFFFLWVYSASVVFILGAEVCWEYERHRNTKQP
ncbi:MAG: YihY/virulence factor BrkB family protein [Nitrospirales bacterium]|nr:YihY/virulence factor BrkB family protein [Nitrospira sp.]MDR4499873.1 YihY/virulence factor BrkB family protein [Nitrospirales bacterium]